MQDQHSSKSRLFFAAANVLIRRPAALLIGLSLLILTVLLIEALLGDSRTVSTRSNTPEYEPSGGKLFIPEEWRAALEDDHPNLDVRRLQFAFLDVQSVAGEPVLILGDIGVRPASGSESEEPLTTKSLSAITQMFPNTQWVSLREEHLTSLPISDFISLKNLDSVEFTTDTLKTEHLSLLSRLPKIRNLTLEATWCDADLAQLADMKNLRSLHLEARDHRRRQQSDADNAEKLITMDHIAQLHELPYLEQLSLNDRDELLKYASSVGLNTNNLATYEQFVKSIRTFPSLKTLYVGKMERPFGNKLLSRMKSDLPNLSIYPATFDSEMALLMGLIGLTMFVGLFVATSHVVMCNSLEQNCLLTGAQKAHLKVYFSIAAVLMTLAAFVVLLKTFAHWSSVVTFLLAVLGLVSSFAKSPSGVQRKSSTLEPAHRKFLTALYLPLTGLVVFVWMGNGFWGAQVAEYFCGQYPLWCLTLTACSILLIIHNAKSLLNVHRLWAESGLTPGTTWRELQESLVRQQNQVMQRNIEAQQLRTGKTICDRWSMQLHNLVANLRRNPTSLILRCRLWIAAVAPAGILWPLICFSVIPPMLILWPVLWQLLAGGMSDTATSGFLSTMLLSELLVLGIFVVMIWHGRQAMYETEILRPVRRSVWRRTVFTSLLATVGVLSSFVWGQIQFIRWLCSFDFNSAWAGLSLVSLVSAILFATASFLLGLIARRVVFAASLILIGLLAYVPMGIIMAAQVSDASALDLFSFPTLLVISLVEFVVGAITLNTAWKSWARLEVAAL